MGDSDSASGDEPSSPLMYKTSRRLETPGAGAPVSKPPKARTRMRPMVSAINDTEAKSTSRRKERPEDTIRKSYKKCGLEASQVMITHEPHTMHPLALYMGSTAKTQSKLTNGRWQKLPIALRSPMMNSDIMLGPGSGLTGSAVTIIDGPMWNEESVSSQ
ncbi:hypothetical protein LTR02_009115 [Friedmanniomyces endolithicus]|nr:hypothetical protein LTR02_009115 [Friedmanniomyces endolithicus]